MTARNDARDRSRNPPPGKPPEQTKDTSIANDRTQRPPSTADAAGTGEAGEGPATHGTLASGYSARSSSGGTPGGVLDQRGSGFSPGDASRVGAAPEDNDPLTRAGVAAGAAGLGTEPAASSRDEPGRSRDTEDYDASDGARAVGGVGGTSGGGSGTTPSDNSRR
jgi:hypothetical protein